MTRWIVLAIVGVMLAVPAASATDWLQPRGDAEATGFQPGGGPSWPDVALRVELEENIMPRWEPTPLILGDRVFLLTYGNYDAYDGSAQVRSVNVTTGQTEVLAEFPVTAPMTMAATDEMVIVGGYRNVHALDLETGQTRWTWSWEPRTQAGRFQVGCTQIAVSQGSLTVLCSEDQWEYADVPGADGGAQTAGRSVVLAARLDQATGDPMWVREWPNATRQPSSSVSLDEPTKGPPSTTVFPAGLAVSSGRAIVQSIHFTGHEGAVAQSDEGPEPVGAGAGAGQGYLAVRALEAATGVQSWNWTSRTVNISQVFPNVVQPPTDDTSRLPLGSPVATDGAVYVKAMNVRKLALGSGEGQWQREVGSKDFNPGRGGGTALAYADGQVFTTTAQTVYKLDGENPQRGWSQSLNFTGQQGFNKDPIVAGSNVYATTYRPDGPGSVYAFATDDGDVRWEHTLADEWLYSFAVSDGLLAYTDVEFFEDHVETDLVVLGETEASPTPTASVSTTYPDRGETVEVDLSASQAGLEGPVTRYKAIWGDGNETAWQADPILSHTYEETGDVTARFVVANEANQTNSTTVTFHVGEEAPTEPNVIEEAFQKDNQDMTFGILGLAVALGGGAIGVARRKKKQATLQQELEALERGFQETQDRPSECEAFLDNRKARARSLAIDGDLEEQQVSIIENRAEELRGTLRLGALEEEFAFLPHGLVTKAREMVQDGDVTSLEREAFLAALEEDEMLTEEQRSIVRERIERWHGRDMGGGAR